MKNVINMIRIDYYNDEIHNKITRLLETLIPTKMMFLIMLLLFIFILYKTNTLNNEMTFNILTNLYNIDIE